MPIAAGSKLGPYVIEAFVGAGGMGEVYRARDPRLGRVVAIKVLPAAFSADPDRLRRFEQEARAAGVLNHPNILAIHDIGTHAGAPYLVSEFLEGGTLRERLASGACPVRKAIDYGLQITQGLGAAHTKGIVHRDLKPENLFLTSDGRVKILDFGLAKLLEPVAAGVGQSQSPTMAAWTEPGLVLGSFAYMAPEQIRGEPADARADLFSFGAVLYEMLNGARAFQRGSAPETMAAILKEEPPDLSGTGRGISPALERIVRHCLEKNPDERFQSARDVGFALGALSGVTDAGSTPVALVSRLRIGDAPRVRWWMALALAGMLVAGAGAGRWWTLRSRDSIWRNPLEGATFTRLTDFEGVETDAVISPDGNFVAFISDRDGPLDVWVLQLASGQFLNLTKGKFPELWGSQIRVLGFSADGSQVTIMSGVGAAGGTAVVPIIGGPIRRLFDNRLDPQWSPDGNRLLFFSILQNRDVMYVADRDGGNPREVFAAGPGEHNHFVGWSADSRYVYSARATRKVQESDIWRTLAIGGKPERITHHNAWTAYPTALDDRTLLYIASDDNNRGTWLYAMDLDRRVEHRLSVGIEQYSSIAASPPLAERARRLVATVSNPVASVWSIPITESVAPESAASTIRMPSAQVSAPSFGPDYLLYLSSRELADGLWKLQGGSATELWNADEGAVLAPPAVSADGRQIAIAALKHGRAGLYVMTSDGSNPQALAQSIDVRESPTWSPDGQTIAVTGSDDEGAGLFLVSLDGTAPVRLYDKQCYLPAWSPDGRYILFAEYVRGSLMQIKAITREAKFVPLPDIQIARSGTRAVSSAYRFLPDGKSLVVQQGEWRRPQFSLIDLVTGARRPLTDLHAGRPIRSFDVSPDGKSIVFDRVQENSDIVLIELAP
jgi:Tol biopolymer transport system component